MTSVVSTSSSFPSVTPSTVVARLIVPCSGLDRPTEQHSVLIHRDGNVTIPDHENSDVENIAFALGEKSQNICEYWWHIPAQIARISTAAATPVRPNTNGWTLQATNAWTTKAVWTALSGMLGERCQERNDPALTLAYIQTYQQNHGLPDNPIRHLTLLASPWTREGGWRRARATTPDELDVILKTGIPVDLASSITALDIEPATLHIALGYLHTFMLPPSLIPQLASVIEPDRIPYVVSHLTAETANYLPSRISLMWKTNATENIATNDIVDYLLAPPSATE